MILFIDKTLYYLRTILIPVVCLFGCIQKNGSLEKENDTSATITSYYENGQLESILTLKDPSKGIGVYKSFYVNGSLKSEVPYVNGGKEGWEEQYDSIGRKISKVHFSQNKQNGRAFWYSESGTLESVSYWINDKQYGEVLFYFNGNVIQKYYVKDWGGKTFYISNYNRKGDLLSEEGFVFSPLIFIRERRNAIIEEHEYPSGNLIRLRTDQEIGITVATPPKVKSKLYLIMKNNSSNIDTLEMSVEKNTAVLKLNILKKGRHTLLFRGEMWRNNNVIKVDTLSKQFIIE